MTLKDNKLPKQALFWAVVVAGFWLLISLTKNRIVAGIGMVVWLALLYVIFYRDAQNKDPD